MLLMPSIILSMTSLAFFTVPTIWRSPAATAMSWNVCDAGGPPAAPCGGFTTTCCEELPDAPPPAADDPLRDVAVGAGAGGRGRRAGRVAVGIGAHWASVQAAS